MCTTRALVILVCLGALQGCATVVLSVAGIAAGAGIKHFITGIPSQTISSPIAGTRLATLKALKRMGIFVEKDETSKDGWTIDARVAKREITIDLEAVSRTSTQIRIDVHREKFIYLKDPSIAHEIIAQTRAEAARLPPRRSRIATVQMMLGELGYDTKNADGVLGPKTGRAILKFQRKNSIRRDGKVSSALMAKLRKKREAVSAARKKARLRELRQ